MTSLSVARLFGVERFLSATEVEYLLPIVDIQIPIKSDKELDLDLSMQVVNVNVYLII